LTPVPTPTTLSGSEWGPTDTVTYGPDSFVRFTDGRISANAGCNQMSASYTQSGAALSIGPIMSTRMACPGDAMAHESALAQALESTASVHTSGEPPRVELVLHDGTGTPILRLQRRDWD